MKKSFFIFLILFSVPIFCMNNTEDDEIRFTMAQGSGRYQGGPPLLTRWLGSAADEEADPNNSANNGYNHYSYNLQFIAQKNRKYANYPERIVSAWNQGVDQVIAQLPLLIISALINEMVNGFPICSRITHLLNSTKKNESGNLAPQFSSIQDTDASIQLLNRLISRLEDEMDPSNPEQRTKLQELKRRKDAHVNALFDKTLEFEELIKKDEATSAA